MLAIAHPCPVLCEREEREIFLIERMVNSFPCWQSTRRLRRATTLSVSVDASESSPAAVVDVCLCSGAGGLLHAPSQRHVSSSCLVGSVWLMCCVQWR